MQDILCTMLCIQSSQFSLNAPDRLSHTHCNVGLHPHRHLAACYKTDLASGTQHTAML
jgi:hypothetical protein